jgi:hypothetical protein
MADQLHPGSVTEKTDKQQPQFQTPYKSEMRLIAGRVSAPRDGYCQIYPVTRLLTLNSLGEKLQRNGTLQFHRDQLLAMDRGNVTASPVTR